MYTKFITATLILFGTHLYAQGIYEFQPTTETQDYCRELGFTGPFELIASSDPRSAGSYWMTFLETDERYPVTQSSSNPLVYSSSVICSFGCDSSLFVELDLEADFFEYKFETPSGALIKQCRGYVR